MPRKETPAGKAIGDRLKRIQFCFVVSLDSIMITPSTSQRDCMN